MKRNNVSLVSRGSQCSPCWGCCFGAAALIPAPDAKAACLGGDGVCAKFNPGSVSTPTSVGGWSGSYTTNTTFDRVLIGFNISNFAGASFQLSGLQLEGDGISPTPLSFAGSINVGANGNTSTLQASIPSFTTSLANPLNFANSKISFTIPAGVGDGTTIKPVFIYSDGAFSFASSGFGFVTTAEVPAPLPALGAGVAFGFSRKLRRRIAASV